MCASGRIRPRLKRSPSLAFGLGTGSLIFLAGKINSAVRILSNIRQKKRHLMVYFLLLVRRAGFEPA